MSLADLIRAEEARQRAARILDYVDRHGAPPEPIPGSAMSVEQFPGAGFTIGTDVDGEAINAYAALVGWRCRFVETMPGTWSIMYDEADRHELDPALVDELDRFTEGRRG